MDGRSLIRLLAGDDARLAARSARCSTELDLDKDAVAPAAGSRAGSQGVREGRWLYVEHTVGPRPARPGAVRGARP